ncbi:hypothetical protein DXO89_19015, partial [Xanthomonas oryzae pv. oryzae]
MSTSCCPTIHEEERRTLGIAGSAGRNAPDGVATDGRRRIAGRSGLVVRVLRFPHVLQRQCHLLAHCVGQ